MPRNSWGTLLDFVLLLAFALGPTHAFAENYAFLVAVQDYDVKDLKPLNYTRSDIAEFARVLQKSGFRPQNIVVLNDKPEKARYMAESDKIRTELDLVLSGVESQDTLIVAFSGHGVQFEGEEKNYYCPLDTNLDDPKRARLIALSEIYEKLKQCPAEKKLLLVDACRNDPLSPVKKSRATVNLKSVTRPQTEPVPKGVVALFSCSAGQESYEWPELKHGVFFHHILEGWNGAAADESKQVTLDALVFYSRKRTQEFARLNLKAIQTPQLKSDFEGTWVLRKVESVDEPEITNKIGMKLRLIPAGEFQMGSPASEVGRSEDEEQHRVKISQSYYLGKHEVTRGEFRKFVEATDYKTEAEKDEKGGYGYTGDEGTPYAQKPEFTWRNTGFTQTDEHPVVNVSWNDAVEFCKWLSKNERKTYRLPTEAEWEYACRATVSTRWFRGDDQSILEQIANVADSALFSKHAFFSYAKSWNDGYVFTAPVGKFSANKFGLHDMHGNVWEWCSDWYDAKYYASSPTNDPRGPETGSSRVDRGGSWYSGPGDCRSAYRSGDSPSYRDFYLGFRVALGTRE